MRADDGKQELRGICQILPSNASIVELGVYAGDSTLVFLESDKIQQIVAVDPFIDEYDIEQIGRLSDPGNPYNTKMSDIEAYFRSNVLATNPRVRLIKEKSVDAVAQLAGQKFDTVYIDADHRYEAVRDDIIAYMSFIKPGGFISGHDYAASWGVKRAVDELFGKPDKLFGISWVKYV
jgi:predicted O-methyltransferase YrrM